MWNAIIFIWLFIIVAGIPLFLTILSFCLPVKIYKNKIEDPNSWRSKKMWKKWMKIPTIPSLTAQDWQRFDEKCAPIISLLNETNKTPCPKSWYGGWGFTGTTFLERGMSSKDFMSILQGLQWLEGELNEIPSNVFIISREHPESFKELSKKVKELISYIKTNNYWDYQSQYSFRGKVIKLYVRCRIWLKKLKAKISPSLKEVGFFILFLFGLIVLSEMFHYILNFLNLDDFDFPSFGELLLTATGCMALRKAYDAVNELISKFTQNNNVEENDKNFPYKIKRK